ncbi:MAG: hypothetical protein AB7K36_23980 [Chloroflexota bacterium]
MTVITAGTGINEPPQSLLAVRQRLAACCSDSDCGKCRAEVSPRFAVALALVAVIVYALIIGLLPSGSVPLIVLDNVGSVLIAGIGSCLALLAARRQVTGQARLSWALLGAGLAAWASGDGYWAWSEIAVGQTPSVPSWSDAAYLAMVVLVITSAALYPIAHYRNLSRPRLLLDAAMLVISAAAVAWSLVLSPLFTHLETQPLTQVITLIYPMGSLTTLLLLAILMVRSAATSISMRLLALGWALVAVADSMYVVLAAADSYVTGHIADLFWFSGVVVIGLAAALERPHPAPSHSEQRFTGRPWQFLLPAVGPVLACAIVWGDGLAQPDGWSPVSVLALIAAAVLLLVRMTLGYRDAVLIHELSMRQSEEREASRLLSEEAARLHGAILTGRELSHLLGNDLAITIGWIDLLRDHPALAQELRPLVDDAAAGLVRASDHLRRLQLIERVSIHETPVGQALDLEHSVAPTPSPTLSPSPPTPPLRPPQACPPED